MKSVAVIALIALGGLLMALTAVTADEPSESVSNDDCVASSAEYLSKAPITDSIKELIKASRVFYPDLETLFNDGMPSHEYNDAMAALGPQEDCVKLLEYTESIVKDLPCFEALDDDLLAILQISEKSSAAKETVEAHFTCQATNPRSEESILVWQKGTGLQIGDFGDSGHTFVMWAEQCSIHII